MFNQWWLSVVCFNVALLSLQSLQKFVNFCWRRSFATDFGNFSVQLLHTLNSLGHSEETSRVVFQIKFAERSCELHRNQIIVKWKQVAGKFFNKGKTAEDSTVLQLFFAQQTFSGHKKYVKFFARLVVVFPAKCLINIYYFILKYFYL